MKKYSLKTKKHLAKILRERRIFSYPGCICYGHWGLTGRVRDEGFEKVLNMLSNAKYFLENDFSYTALEYKHIAEELKID